MIKLWKLITEIIFNKAHGINKDLIASKTPYFTIVDMDRLTREKNIHQTIYLLEKGLEWHALLTG